MANKQRGYVAIELDKPRYLRYKMNSIAKLEQALGQKVTKLDIQNLGITEMITILWAGLIHEQPDLSIEQAGDLMDEAGLQYISEKIKEAFEAAFGSGEETKNNQSGLNGIGQQ